MWIWLDKTGKVKQYLIHGPSPVAGETDFQIFAYFDGLNTDFFEDAAIRFRRPDINRSTFEFRMIKTSLSYEYMEGDGSMSNFNTNHGPYTGYLFDFSDFTEDQEEVCFLDTPGLWNATITLMGGNKISLSGLITFNVGDSTFVSDEAEEPTDSQIISNYIKSVNPLKKNSIAYVKVSDDFITKAENGELDITTFVINSIVLDETSKLFYKIVSVSKNPLDDTKVYASFEDFPLEFVQAEEFENALEQKEDKSNKTTIISSDSTDAQYPSAKAVYNSIETVSERIADIEAGFTTQDINTSSISVQYAKSTSKIVLTGNNNEWVERNLPTNELQYSGSYGNNYFITCGYDGTIVYSKNAENWTLFSPTFSSQTFNKICYGNGYFLMACYATGDIYQAYEANAWNTNFTRISNINIKNILYINNMFCICGENGKIGFSDRGKEFEKIDLLVQNDINGIAYGGGSYLIVGNGGFIAYSKNRKNWFNISNNEFIENYKGAIYGKDTFLIYTDNTLKYCNSFYQFNNANISLTNGQHIQDIIYAETKFYVLTTNNTTSEIFESTNGITFTKKAVLNETLYSLCYGNDNLVALGNGLYNLNFEIEWSYDKPELANNEYLWSRNVSYLNNGDILYSPAYFMGFVDKTVNNLENYYNKITTNGLLDEKQDDMLEISNDDINTLFIN